MKTLKKLFSVSAIVALLGTLAPMYAFGATYSDELQDAYKYAYAHEVTTMTSIDNANMYGNLDRISLAKMIANYAINVLGMTPDTTKSCTFPDVTAAQDAQYDNGVTKACQLGLMGVGIEKFNPKGTVTRAEFGTAFSRALNADSDDLAEMNAATPYYKKHLEFLKSEGIMNQIDNPNQTEVRGYVMLMMMRSDDSYSPETVEGCTATELLACITADDYDACIAACSQEPEEPVDPSEVKAGTLTVTVKGSNGNVFIGRDSELDGLTLKTSEEITINRVTLERIGYSSVADIDSVRLEDDNGVKLTDPKSLDSKGQVKLTIKKDYKVVDGTMNAVIVVKTKASLQPNSTVGFKVIDIDSSAEKVNLPSNAYTYTAISYNGSNLNITFRPVAKDYNYVAGEKYVVAKFKAESPDDASIVLKGFTLKNKVGGVDLRRYFDSAEVTVAGEAVRSLSANVNKNDELVVSFKEEEIAAKSKAEVIVKIALSDEFNDYGKTVDLDLLDVVAVDGKVSSRVSTNIPANGMNLTQTYTFNGSKVKLTNVKLGNVDAAQNSEDVEVAEGTIEISEAVKGSLKVVASGKGIGAIKELTLSVNGEEYDAHASDYAFTAYPSTTATAGMATGRASVNTITVVGTNTLANLTVTENSVPGWTGDYCILLNDTNAPRYQLYNDTACSSAVAGVFVEPVAEFNYNNITIERSGKIKFFLDTKDEATWNGEAISFSSVDKDAFTALIYDESGKPVNDVAGSISFSKVTIQSGKASLTNTATKDVEFLNNETNRKVVFDGVYTAKKGDTNINAFSLAGVDPTPNKVTFYLIVNGNEVADARVTTAGTATETFDDILIQNGKTASIVVEAEVEAKAVADLGQFALTIDGEDVNGNIVSTSAVKTAKLKVVDKGSLNVTSTLKDTVLKKASNQNIAVFTVKPANGASEANLEEVTFKVTSDGTADIATLDADKITVSLDDVVVDDCTKAAGVYTCSLNENVTASGSDVKIAINDEYAGKVVVNTLTVNGKPQSKTFTRLFVNSLVQIVDQKDMGGTTQFTLNVDEDDTALVSNLAIFFDDSTGLVTYFDDDGAFAGGKDWDDVKADTTLAIINGSFTDGDTVEAKGVADVARMVTAIVYKQGASYVVIKKADFNDFFKIGETYARVFKSN